jgi:hypothetical protein
MDALPSPVRRLIEAWTLDFERADAHDRMQASGDHRAALRHVVEDIRRNPPTYMFDILTQSRAHVRMPVTLPDCDPQRVRTGLRLPESHIVAWKRLIHVTWVESSIGLFRASR